MYKKVKKITKIFNVILNIFISKIKTVFDFKIIERSYNLLLKLFYFATYKQ